MIFIQIRKILYFFLILLFLCSSTKGNPLKDLSLNKKKDFFIHNKVLFKIEDTVITVWDVIKKMNLLFYQNFPNLIDDTSSKIQFYTTMWMYLKEIIIDEFLILSDAKEKKIEVDSSEVKQEVDRIFGSNLVLTAHSLNMTEEEIIDIVKRDLIVQRTLNFLARSKASLLVTPRVIRENYRKNLSKFKGNTIWRYLILNIKGEKDLDEIATNIESFLNEKGLDKTSLEKISLEKQVEIFYSEEFCRSEDILSDFHKETLTSLHSEGKKAKKVISSKDQIIKIFFIQNREKEELRSFASLEEEIRQQLITQVMEESVLEYKKKLRERYGYVSNHVLEENEALLSWL